MQVNANTEDVRKLQISLNAVENRMTALAGSVQDAVKRSELADIMMDFENSNTQREWLVLNGEVVEADIAHENIYASARKSIFVVDNYIGLKTLVLLKNVPENVQIILFSDNIGNRLHRKELEDFQKEYPSVRICMKKTEGRFHDRYIILDHDTDDERIYHCGASSKDAGRHVTSITEVREKELYRNLIDEILQAPDLILQ